MNYKKTVFLAFVLFLAVIFASLPAFADTPAASPSAQSEEDGIILFPDGTRHSPDETCVNLSALPSNALHDVAPLLRRMPALVEVYLGNENVRPEGDEPFPWDDIRLLQKALPGILVDYRFSLYGKEFSLLDTEIDLNHITIEDEAEYLRSVLPYLSNCRYLDMDFCGVSDETMAAIRDEYPEIEVVWRIWFGFNCSVRTDCERILASSPEHGIADSNTGSLKYCTKVKYLDLGHNDKLHDFSFMRYMPDLEVAIIAISGLKDLTPVGECTNLEYLEINSCMNGMDLTPLANCKKLHHLNICWLFKATGFRALGELKELERLWIGKMTEISAEDLAYLREALPNTTINTKELTGCGGSWRIKDGGGLTDRYALLRQQFDYDHYNTSCSAFYNDPKYFTDPNQVRLYRVPFDE